MIVTNAITIGIEADHAEPDSQPFFILGTIYLVVFTLELSLNLFGFGTVFWEVFISLCCPLAVTEHTY